MSHSILNWSVSDKLKALSMLSLLRYREDLLYSNDENIQNTGVSLILETLEQQFNIKMDAFTFSNQGSCGYLLKVVGSFPDYPKNFYDDFLFYSGEHYTPVPYSVGYKWNGEQGAHRWLLVEYIQEKIIASIYEPFLAWKVVCHNMSLILRYKETLQQDDISKRKVAIEQIKSLWISMYNEPRFFNSTRGVSYILFETASTFSLEYMLPFIIKKEASSRVDPNSFAWGSDVRGLENWKQLEEDYANLSTYIVTKEFLNPAWNLSTMKSTK